MTAAARWPPLSRRRSQNQKLLAEVASAVITLEQRTPGANHAIAGGIGLVPGAAIPADAVIAVIVWAVVAIVVSVGHAERRGGDRVRSSNRGAGHVGRSNDRS
jgi:hypothetical protein